MSSPTPLIKRVDKRTLIERLGAPIWDNIYMVFVKYEDTLSAESIRQHGMPTVGDPDIDQQMRSQRVSVAITINDMVEYYRRGVIVTLQHNENAEAIYNVINNYLLAWKDQIEKGINIGDAPFDDLTLLDQFAAVVYPHARAYGGSDKNKTSLFANLFTSNQQYVNRNSLFAQEAPASAPVQTAHESLTKDFMRFGRDNPVRKAWR